MSARDIQSNDAFKCAVLAADALNKLLDGFMARKDPAFGCLWTATQSVLSFARTARISADVSDVPRLLHLAALYIYDHLRQSLLDDMCTYRRIEADQALIAFAGKLTPSIDARVGGNPSVYRQLAQALDSRSGRVGVI